MQKLGLVLFVFAISLTTIAQEAPLKLTADKTLSVLTYGMNHPMHAWIGESKNFNAVILCDKNKQKISKVAVSVKIASFDSQNANRDSHTIEVTEALKYPSITFSSESVVQNGEKLTVTGVLTFHGVKKRITFEAIQKTVSGKLEVSGGFTIKMTDYKIDPPTLLGIAADDEVKITFKTVY
jgi:polyisoprenoid-binding protein YceI